MPRTLTTDVANAAAAGTLAACIAVALSFDSGVVRVTNAGQDFVFNGYTWLGVGHLGGIGSIEEGGNLEARGVQLELSGIPADHVAIALGEDCQGRQCDIWLVLLNTSTYAVLPDPKLLFRGRMDAMAIELGDTASVVVTAESRLVDLKRPRSERFNDADQKSRYPSDRGLEYVELMVEREILWGKS